MKFNRALALLLLLAFPAQAFAITKLEGEYQLMLELQKGGFNRPFRWDWNSNEYDTYNNAQLRMFATPRAGVESFLKVEAAFRPNDNSGARAEFQYREAHVRFRKQFGAREWDNYFFSRQDRFWSEPFQVQVFDNNQHGFRLDPLLYGRGDWQGIRSEYKGSHGFNMTVIAADQSGQISPTSYTNLVPHAPLDSLNARAALRTNDMYVLRLRRDFLKEARLKLGFMMTRSENWAGADSLSAGTGRVPKVPGQGIWAMDGHTRVFGSDINFVYAESYPHIAAGNGQRSELTIGKRSTNFQLPDAALLEAEVRSIRLGTPRTGYINLVPIWWTRGLRWYNPTGAPGGNETGFLLQSYYLVPERAVTLTHNFGWTSNDRFREVGTRYTYDEMYVEFVNGFTGKTAYRQIENYGYTFAGLKRTPHRDLIVELQVESRLASLRVQGKAADIGSPQFAKQVFVIEQSINISPKAKIFNRFAFGNDADKLRKSIFTQLQYRPTGSMEMFLQYGPDYIGGGSYPVDEGALNGGGDQFDQIKFILKGNF